MAYQQLAQNFDPILKLMPVKFNSHEFIRELKAQYPHQYNSALKQYQIHPKRKVHARIAKDLKRLGKAKHIANVRSKNIFGKRSSIALWEKFSIEC